MFLNNQCRVLSLAAAIAMFFAVGVFALESTVTAYVPIVVNAKGKVRAEYTGNTAVWDELNVWPDEEDTLRLPLQGVTGIAYTQRQANVPAIIRTNGGKITINLPAQSYKNAEVSLYAVNGKKILRRNVNAENAVNNIAIGNIATGAYLLSVRGSDGNALTASRLMHSGGSLNINAAFGGDARSSAQRQAKSVAGTEVWTIKIKADGYEDSSYTIAPDSGINPRQVIKLRSSYASVKIGTQTWMVRNMNAVPQVGKSWCSDGTTSCDKYGRHYSWAAAQEVCPAGWHLPTRAEWDKLAEIVGGQLAVNTDDRGGEWHTWLNAGKKLKASRDWANDRETDSLGFSALPGGNYDEDLAVFKDVRTLGSWWTSTENRNYGGVMVYTKQLKNQDDRLTEMLTSTWFGCSVRCIKD